MAAALTRVRSTFWRATTLTCRATFDGAHAASRRVSVSHAASFALIRFETDFRDVVAVKRRVLQSDAALRALLAKHVDDVNDDDDDDDDDNVLSSKRTAVDGRRYVLFASDLRDPAALLRRLARRGFDASAPTLVVCECVLTYLSCEASDRLLVALRGALKEMAVITCESAKRAAADALVDARVAQMASAFRATCLVQ